MKMKSAILMIDMQKVFLDYVSFFAKIRLVSSVKECLAYASSHDVPVVNVLYKGSGGLSPDLQGHMDDVPRVETIEKPGRDAFGNGSLDGILKGWGVKGLVMMGLYASGCVKATSQGAKGHRYRIITAEDLISDAIGEAYGKSRVFYGKALLKSHRDVLEYLRENKSF